MEIILKYDLMDKVKETNAIINYKKILLNKLKELALAFGSSIVIDDLMENQNIFCLKTFVSIMYLINVLNSMYYANKYKYERAFAAYLELIDLEMQFNDNFIITTNSDLLAKAELIKTDYIIKFNKNKIPIIENKYILIPTYDSLGNIKETSFLQKHYLNSEKWVLSLGSPKKVLKLGYNHI